MENLAAPRRLIPPRFRKPAILLAGLALVLLAGILLFRGWDRYVEDRLGRWAVAEVARRTGGAYRLTLGDLSFLPLAGSIALDSAIVTTDSVRNRLRPTPLPSLEWQAHECRVSGLDVLRLLLRKTFVAGELGCRRVAAAIALAGPAEKPGASEADSSPAPGPVEALARPLGLRSFAVADVSFPAVRFTLRRPGARGGTSIHLERARFEAKGLVFDPAPADSAAPRTLSADRARLSATGLLLKPDTLIEVAAAGFEADFIESTLRVAGVRHEPSIPEAEWVRRVRVRRDRITFELDSLRARGVEYRTFVSTGAIALRALELDGPRLDVLTDRRIPRGRPIHHRTPQQVAAERGPGLRLDSVLVVGGTIAYRERRPGSERPGRVSFDAVRATVLDLRVPAGKRPLRIAARARLMNEGALAVEATVPLDAADFRYELSGRLGPMPAPAFNRFLSENEAFEFAEGAVDEIEFRQTVKAGRARTTATPRYHDLSVEPTGEGGGVAGSVKRTVKKFVANAFVVRSRNPGEDGKELHTAWTVHRYVPSATWIQFVWFGLRDATMEALKE